MYKLSWIVITLFLSMVYSLNLFAATFKINQPVNSYKQNELSSKVPSKIFQTGKFKIEWHNSYFSIRNKDNPSKIIFQTIPGHNFIEASVADIKFTEHRGSFQLDERILKTLAYQTVDEISHKDNKIIIKGFLYSSDKQNQKKVAYTMGLYEIQKSHLKFEIFLNQDEYGKLCNELLFIYRSTEDERFLGFGEQFSYIDLKSHKVPILSQEGGIGRGREPITTIMNTISKGSGGNAYSTYIAMPYYITSKARSLFLENTEYSVFDLEDPHKVTVKIFKNNMQGRILYGKTPLELIERYTEYTGRMQPLPDWINEGAIIGMQGGTDAVYRIWENLKKYDTPIAGFWIQDWVGKRKTVIGSQLWWNWQLDKNIYHDWDKLISDFQKENIRALGYINTFLVDASPKGYIDRNYFKEAIDTGYLVKKENGEPYFIKNTDFDAIMIDLSNIQARTWLKNIIKTEMIDKGFSGWMADFSEALPFDASLLSKENADSYHNKYPVEWASVNREAIKEAGKEDEIVFFNRAGYTKSPSYSRLFWEGDQMVTWDQEDGFKSAIKGLISGGISGLSLNHSDIGGYTSISAGPLNIFKREKSLLMRWIEANAFTSVFRTHEGNEPEKNAQFYTDKDTYTQFAKFAKVYKALAFYRKQLMQEAWQKGYPLVRHPFLHYTEDDFALFLSYQWMLGPDFMVAPVTDKYDTTKWVYLPEGLWSHLWTGNIYGNPNFGVWIKVNAPIGEPPVFFLKDSEAGKTFVNNLKSLGVLQE